MELYWLNCWVSNNTILGIGKTEQVNQSLSQPSATTPDLNDLWILRCGFGSYVQKIYLPTANTVVEMEEMSKGEIEKKKLEKLYRKIEGWLSEGLS